MKLTLTHSVKYGHNTVQQQIEDGIQIGGFIPFQVTITDEASRININEAEVDLIRNLLSYLGVQPEINEIGDLATRIVEGRPYRTVRDVARVEGMTKEILYGLQQQAAVEEATSGSDEPLPPTLSLNRCRRTCKHSNCLFC